MRAAGPEVEALAGNGESKERRRIEIHVRRRLIENRALKSPVQFGKSERNQVQRAIENFWARRTKGNRHWIATRDGTNPELEGGL